MKILIINSVCGIGSTGKICVQIANLATTMGHDCVIAYGRGKAKGYNKLYKIESSFGNKLHFLKSKLFDGQGLGSFFATKKLVKFIKDYSPDVIHLHNIHGYYLNYKVLFSFLSRFNGKILWTFHDLWPFTGHCAYPGDCEKWIGGCENCKKLNEYPKSVLDKSRKNYLLKKKYFNLPQKLTIVTPSKWLSELAKKSFLKKYEICVINNGIDTSIFKPTSGEFREKHNLQNKKIILGVSNVWDKRKGLNDFISLSKMIDSNTVIVLVGLNDEQLQILPSNIVGLKRTNGQKELAEIYTTSDIFVNFTYDDNFPTVNMESIACGTPVLTYKTGGSYEMIDENTGFGVKTGDLNSAFEIIKKFKKNDKMVNDCLLKAKFFEKDQSFLQYIKEYEK